MMGIGSRKLEEIGNIRTGDRPHDRDREKGSNWIYGNEDGALLQVERDCLDLHIFPPRHSKVLLSIDSNRLKD